MLEFRGPIAIVCALERELAHALRDVEEGRESQLGPWKVVAGTIQGRAVRLLQCGIGMVNAAGALGALAARERPAVVVNYGCAGAHRSDVLPGDIVVAEAVVAPGALTILPNGQERYTGMFCTLDASGTVERIAIDPALVSATRAAAQAWAPEAWPWRRPEQAENRVHFGVVASADCWTQHPPRIELLHLRHASLCEDMEAASLAQICGLWDIPFLTVNDISNNELLDVTPLGDDLPTLEPFGTEIGGRAWQLLRRVLPSLDRAGEAR